MSHSDQTSITAREAGLMLIIARYELALNAIADDYETGSRSRELAERALGAQRTEIAR